ncbi:methyltransferase domain-containing protein [Pseudidiomarina sp. 1APP75-32.1]|uniref:Methyltransferase domain-containing protein n=1 Tax=Pseudidiomarina terrestris TaxID=2820060 RepID=A0AAW7R2J8_9GAMM|nr:MULTISPECIES: methyltransferase domain-containing protein [unclassified Pseudidiomarina]MDN7124855.1 methyltransferase domain-containing protein [Pseudidiomarina sp. 1APP75-32.1]MDN7129671.1 methyltransferase domain-containing protein [Pseudidiomarina sp. 1APR75-15]
MTTSTSLIKPFAHLCCPLDGEPLTLADKTWRCGNGHSFDVAKQGYVNLLPVQNKRSKDPGDSKTMVQARADFLAGGFYQPLADALAATVLRGDPGAVLDAGCGEGYYLRQLLDAAERSGYELEVAALDISKSATLAAAKQDKRVTWMVASNSQIPVAANSIDALLCVFGFPVSGEFQRVLKPGGRLVMVDPAADHLSELKQVIYAEVKAKPYQLPVPSDAWELVSEQRLTFAVHLPTNGAIRELLTMTPHLYRASNEGRARAEALSELTVTVDVWLREFTAR